MRRADFARDMLTESPYKALTPQIESVPLIRANEPFTEKPLMCRLLGWRNTTLSTRIPTSGVGDCMERTLCLSLMRSVIRGGVLPLASLLLAVVFALGSVLPQDTGAFVFEAPYLKQSFLDVLKEGVETGGFDTAPQIIKESNERQLELLEITQQGDLARSLAAQAELARIDLELYESGNLVADPLMLQAKYTLLHSLAQRSNPALYGTTAEEPGLYRVAEVIGTLPPMLVPLIPVVVGFLVLKNMESKKLLFQVPCSTIAKMGAAIIAVTALSLAVFLVSLVPACFINTVLHGLGDPSYPVVFIQGGTVVSTTIGGVLARTFIVVAMVALFVGLLQVALFAVLGSAIPGAAAAVALAFVPSIPQYYDKTFLLHDIAAYLPTTYLFPANVAGFPAYINAADLMPIAGANMHMGCVVLAASSSILLVGVLAACLAHQRSLRGKRC